MDNPAGPTEAAAMLAMGRFIGVAIAVVVQAHARGAAVAAEQAVGVLVGMAVLLGRW